MNDNNSQFTRGARVRLKDGVDSGFYEGMAKVGNEGWVAAQRKDKFGLPEVFIKWDPEHWAYNRQPDCWTYEDHFELVGRKTMSESNDEKKEHLIAATAQFVDTMAKLLGLDDDPQPQPEAPKESLGAKTVKARFRASQEQAIEAFKGDDVQSFVVVVVKQRPNPDAPRGELGALVLHDALTPESEMLIGAQLSHVAAQYHEAAAILNVYEIMEKDDDAHGTSE